MVWIYSLRIPHSIPSFCNICI